MITLVTGATSGIGEATAKAFAGLGHNLIVTGRRNDRLQKLKKELEALNVEVLTLNFDVRNRKEVETTLKSLPDKWQEVDILVNNAGLAAGKEPIMNGNPDDWEQMIDTNIKGLLYVSRTVLPLMCARRKGHIINICSIAGKEVYAEGGVYCASKAAVDFLSKSMRIDALPYGIKITNVCPGAVETEFSMVRFKGDTQKAAATYKGFKPLTAKDVAQTIIYCSTLPPHVNINDLVLMPTAQANATTFFRSE
ncbi:MAG: SDR family NAD(P)-dependent oxidoreductase [Bacteroidales bacterium]|jgi:NADP-dependent 3-hydroxy acid dehydrogenase YdfG|nr:SDR family NAD(P)-dependent oxidoreductase [Bacteroidales bacterium]